MAHRNGKRVFICGVGMTKFEKPGRRDDFDYPEMVKECVDQALNDAGILYDVIQQAVAGYCYGESTCGQRALYQFGLTGIPVYNVNNNCATGSTALYMAKNLIEGGTCDCILAVGFEKMERGSLGAKWTDRTMPVDKHMEVLSETYGFEGGPPTAQIFGNAGREHMEKYGTTLEHFAKIAYKNHKHSVNNTRSQFRDEYTLEQIKDAKMIHTPLTKLQCCPTSDGGAAAIVCSEEFILKHGLQHKAVEILAMEMATDTKGTFEEKSMMKVAGQDMTRKASEKAFSKAGLSPSDVQVVELHDCFSANELITYEGLGLCETGKAGEFIDRGDNTYGGKYVINPSGGLISKGHPLGATGLAQCFELCNQLRGECGKRQVNDARIGLQHNLGLGGACVVGLYKKMTPLKIKNVNQIVGGIEKTFKSDVVFANIETLLEKQKDDLMRDIKSVVCFELNKEDDIGRWNIDLKNCGVLQRGSYNNNPDITIKMTDDDCMLLSMGKMGQQKAFEQRRCNCYGDLNIATKVLGLLTYPVKSKL